LINAKNVIYLAIFSFINNRNNDPMHIREAQCEDALNIKYLKTQVWLHTYATKGICSEYTEYLYDDFSLNRCTKLIQDKNRCCLVAEKEGFLLGYCEINLDHPQPHNQESHAEMTVLYVSEHFHGQGIGKALILAAEKKLKTLGHSAYWLACFIENQHAIDFYNHRGFIPQGSTFFSMNDNKYENIIFHKEILK